MGESDEMALKTLAPVRGVVIGLVTLALVACQASSAEYDR